MTKTTYGVWSKRDEKIITRFRRMCKQGHLIELPKFKGSMKARFIDATSVRVNPKTMSAKAILYTVSRNAGVVRTWIPIDSVRFQNDGHASLMNPEGANHNPDSMELAVLRYKQKMAYGYASEIREFVDRFNKMVKRGGGNHEVGALYRLLDELGANTAMAEKTVGNIATLDRIALDVMKRNPEQFGYALYTEYYNGYPM